MKDNEAVIVQEVILKCKICPKKNKTKSDILSCMYLGHCLGDLWEKSFSLQGIQRRGRDFVYHVVDFQWEGL